MTVTSDGATIALYSILLALFSLACFLVPA
jgi:hypothetical protein